MNSAWAMICPLGMQVHAKQGVGLAYPEGRKSHKWSKKSREATSWDQMSQLGNCPGRGDLRALNAAGVPLFVEIWEPRCRLSHTGHSPRNVAGAVDKQWYCRMEKACVHSPDLQTRKLALSTGSLHTLPTFNPSTLPRTSVVTGYPIMLAEKGPSGDFSHTLTDDRRRCR